MKDDHVFLLQILEFIEKIDTYTQNGKEEFMLTPLIQDAVIRNFEIIGEAVKQVSDQIKRSCRDPLEGNCRISRCPYPQIYGSGSGCCVECGRNRSPDFERKYYENPGKPV